MPLTVDQALDRTALAGSTVVGGREGLNREIRRVAILEWPGAEDTLTGGEMVLSSGYLLHQSATGVDAFVRKLVSARCSGVVFKFGRHLQEIPLEAVALADAERFPLIKTDSKLPLQEILYSIAEHIVNDELASLRHKAKVYEQCLLTAGGDEGIQGLLQKLSVWTGNPITFEDEDGDMIASASASITPVLWAKLNPKDAKRITVFNQASKVESHVGGQLVKRLVALVKAGGQTSGFLSMWETNRSADWRDEIMLMTMAPLVGLEFRKQIEIHDVENLQTNYLIDDLLYGSSSSQVMQARLKTLGLDPDKPCIAEVIMISEPRVSLDSSPKNMSARLKIKSLVEMLQDILNQVDFEGAVVGKGSEEIISLITFPLTMAEAEAHRKSHELALLMVKAIRQKHPDLKPVVGVGKHGRNVLDFPQSYYQARQAIKIGKALLDEEESVFLYDRLGVYRLLANHSGKDQLESLINDVLGRVIYYDAKYNSQLIETLKVYFANDGNMSKGAETLYVHPNTFLYRLHKIHELTGLDWRKLEDRLQLQLAMKILQLVCTQPDLK